MRRKAESALRPVRVLNANSTDLTRESIFGTDVLLAILIALTSVDLSIRIAGFPIGVGEMLLVPVLFISLFSKARATLPPAYLVLVVTYLLWVGTTLAWTDDLRGAIGPTVQYVQFFLLTAILFVRVRNRRGLVAVVATYVTSATVLSLAVVAFAVVTHQFSYIYFLNYQKNFLGATVGDAIPLLIGLFLILPRRRRLLAVAIALNSVALVFSTSRGALLGAMVAIVVMLVLIGRIRYGLILASGVAILLWLYAAFVNSDYVNSISDFSSGSSAYSRILIFDDAARFISRSPVLGSGPGSYHIEIPSIGFSQNDPSNVFLLTLAESGAIGLALFALVLLCILVTAAKNTRVFRDQKFYLVMSAALTGAFCSHFAHIQIDVSWVRGTGTFMFACVGMLFALRRVAFAERGTCVT